MRWFATILLVTLLLSGSVTEALSNPPSPASGPADSNVEGLALQCFSQMRAGQIDRSQLTADYSAQLTDNAVRSMSRYLKEYDYGTSPSGAQILLRRSRGDQTFYVVKILFPRGDAASLLIGLDPQGKISGISLMSMAGD
jgi:hypothetical protein